MICVTRYAPGSIVEQMLWSNQALCEWTYGLLYRKEFMPGTVNFAKNSWLESSQAQVMNLGLVCYLMDTISGCPLYSYLCTHTPVQLSDLIKEVCVVNDCYHRNSQLITLQRMCQWSAQPLMRHCHQISPPQGHREHHTRGDRNIIKARHQKVRSLTLSPGHDMIAVLLNS